MEAKDMKPVGTKVSPEAYARLMSICKEKGITLYDMLQMFCDIILRFMDGAHNLSEELNQIVALFDGMKDWDKSITLTDDHEKHIILEAFYVLSDADKKGERLVHIDGQAGTLYRQADYNINQMVERFVSLAQPQLYKHMRLIGSDMGTNSILETMHKLAELYRENPDQTELRIMFESNDWAENAKRISDQQPMARRHERHDPTLF